MHLIVCICGITAGVFQDYFFLISLYQFLTFRVDLLAEPPGCSRWNSVKSQTRPSTTSQQSDGVVCLPISVTEMSFSAVILPIYSHQIECR